MKIIPFDTTGEFTLYCPSMDETILSSENKEVNREAEAFIAGWMDERNHYPVIKDSELLASWNEYLRKSFKKEPVTDEMVTKFLRRHRNPDWIVYTGSFEPANESIGSYTVWLVVMGDTIIE